MIIYITTNLINNKKYLGKDSRNIKSYLGSGSTLKKAINKYGRKNFKKDIIEYCKNDEELGIREEYWLNFYDAANNPLFYNRTNKTSGYKKGRKHTQETKDKMSIIKLGKKDSDYTKELKRQSKLGNINRRGLKCSEETKQKMRKPKSEEHIKNMTGRKDSEESKQKKSLAKIGKESNRCKEIIQYRYEIIKIPIKVFKSAKEAERELGISSVDISNTCNNKQKTAGGYIWTFKT